MTIGCVSFWYDKSFSPPGSISERLWFYRGRIFFFYLRQLRAPKRFYHFLPEPAQTQLILLRELSAKYIIINLYFLGLRTQGLPPPQKKKYIWHIIRRRKTWKRYHKHIILPPGRRPETRFEDKDIKVPTCHEKILILQIVNIILFHARGGHMLPPPSPSFFFPISIRHMVMTVSFWHFEIPNNCWTTQGFWRLVIVFGSKLSWWSRCGAILIYERIYRRRPLWLRR